MEKAYWTTNPEQNWVNLFKERLEEYLTSKNLVQLKNKYEKRIKVFGVRQEAILREIAQDEIVIEFDTVNDRKSAILVNITIRKLWNDNYNFYVYDHKGKSPHIHIYGISALDDMDSRLASFYKKEFIKKYANHPETDMSLTRQSQLIAFEFRSHFKYGTTKDIVAYYQGCDCISNHIDINLLNRAKIRLDKEIEYTQNTTPSFYDNIWFIRWVLSEKLPTGGIDLFILKNLAILVKYYNLDTENFYDRLSKIYGSKAIGQFNGWLNWCKKGNRTFGYFEICRYAERHNIDIKEVRRRWQVPLKTS